MNPLIINGVVVAAPISGSWDDGTLSTSESGRDSFGNMNNDIITTKGNFPYTWGYLSAEETATLLQAVKKNGFGDIDFYRNIARYLSFAFFDIKSLDPYLHKKFTGGSVDAVIEFSKEFSKIAERNEIDVIARIPIIPGFNNDIQHISQIARFVKEELNGINKIEILPFHKLGQNKYESIGRVYKYQEFNSFKTSMFEEYKEEINKFGIDVISF